MRSRIDFERVAAVSTLLPLKAILSQNRGHRRVEGQGFEPLQPVVFRHFDELLRYAFSDAFAPPVLVQYHPQLAEPAVRGYGNPSYSDMALAFAVRNNVILRAATNLAPEPFLGLAGRHFPSVSLERVVLLAGYKLVSQPNEICNVFPRYAYQFETHFNFSAFPQRLGTDSAPSVRLRASAALNPSFQEQ